MTMTEPDIDSKPWTGDGAPRRILVIRMQAMGDVVISLPYVQHLRRSLPPEVRIDFLTGAESADILSGLVLFDHVYQLGGGRNARLQLLSSVLLLPALLLRRYDVVLDLQNNRVSRLIRKALRPTAWAAFDRFSANAAGERNRRTIEAAGLGPSGIASDFICRNLSTADRMLQAEGWTAGTPLVVLNPAGAFENRNWPIPNYIQFASDWLQCYPQTRFLVLGLPKIAASAAQLKAALGPQLIDLTGKTSPGLAFAMLQRATLMLSEDSGLMHMAWVSGVPTFALFGSTRSDWAQPLGPHTAYVDSSDLPCGSCMAATCRHEGEMRNFCMTRLSPEMVLRRALKLVSTVR